MNVFLQRINNMIRALRFDDPVKIREAYRKDHNNQKDKKK